MNNERTASEKLRAKNGKRKNGKRNRWRSRMRDKTFKLAAQDVQDLLEWAGPDGCIATDRITVDGYKVGYMYREEPDGENPDSGWRFLEGNETDAYLDDAGNSGIYALNTICNYDPDIIPLLHAPYGTAFVRNEKGDFVQEDFESPQDTEQ